MGQILARFSPDGRKYMKLASSGDFEAACQMLQAQPQLVTCRTLVSKKSILHYAAGLGRVEIFQFAKIAVNDLGGEDTAWLNLLDNKSRKGFTPFLIACKEGKIECVEFLLEAGANVLAKESVKRKSALHLAARGHSAVMKLLVANSTQILVEGEPQVLRNIECRDAAGQSRWLDNRAVRGLTALHEAVMHQSLDCVLLLLEAGASIFALTILDEGDFAPEESISGSTLLHIAARHGDIAIIQALLQAQADVMRNMSAAVTGMDHNNWEGDPGRDLRAMRNVLRQTPYHVALRLNNWGVAQLLHPGVPIAVALDNARSTDEGIGPRRLSVLCGIAHRNALLGWLERHKQNEVAQIPTNLTVWHKSENGMDTTSTITDCFGRAVSAPHPLPSLVTRSSVHLVSARSLPDSSRLCGLPIDGGSSSNLLNFRVRIGSSSSTTECGICMDSNAAISMQPCGHRLCHSCALQICCTSLSTPICPFCRESMALFEQD